MSQVTLPGFRVTLEPETDAVRSLWDIVDCYQRKTILKPPHQRDRVWDEDKKSAWVERLRSGKRPVGVIVTYQINDGHQNPTNLNDGYQRVSATLEYLENPEKYGDSPEDAERIVRSCIMPWQHRHYHDDDEALYDFQALNLGTALTAFEFYKGILTYMPGYSQWEPIISELHGVVPQNEPRVAMARYAVSREEQHKRWRADFAMFHRFIDGSNTIMDYTVTEQRPRQNPEARQQIVEWQLRETLKAMPIADGRDKLSGLQRLVDRETALMESIWYGNLGKNHAIGMSPTLYRWILDVSVWKRNAGINQADWEDFVRRILDVSDGHSQLVCMKDDGRVDRKYTLNLARLTSLKGVCEVIGSNLYSLRPERRTKKIKNLRSGYDESHVLPFSTNGNGETFPEPASRNRSRGARPVEVSNV